MFSNKDDRSAAQKAQESTQFRDKYGTTPEKQTYTNAAIHRRMDSLEIKLNTIIALLESEK